MSYSSKGCSGLFSVNKVDNNVYYTGKKYGLSNSGYFGVKGKKGSASWIRQIYTENPEVEASHFYDLLSNGGKEKPLTNGHGFISTMSEGSKITIRIKTSSKGSPAVDLNLEGFHKGVKSHQKIHFVSKED